MAEIEITKASEVKVREIEWLWYPCLLYTSEIDDILRCDREYKKGCKKEDIEALFSTTMDMQERKAFLDVYKRQERVCPHSLTCSAPTRNGHWRHKRRSVL